MEFGRLSRSELKKVDFRLPAEPQRNGHVLPGKSMEGKVYVGMTQWGNTEWVSKIYPSKTKETDFLSHYIQQFNSVELNATHYILARKELILKWVSSVGKKDFKFCPKMYKGITHQGPLNNKQSALDSFLQGIQHFGDHLGPIFIQLHENFNRKRELFEFLESLPIEFQFFLELRHPALIANAALFDYLEKGNTGAVITDTAGRRDCAHMNLTVPKTFIRFICNNGHPTDFTRINEWAERIKVWLENGIKEVYFFVHMQDEKRSLDMANYAIKTFNQICETNVPELNFIK